MPHVTVVCERNHNQGDGKYSGYGISTKIADAKPNPRFTRVNMGINEPRRETLPVPKRFISATPKRLPNVKPVIFA